LDQIFASETSQLQELLETEGSATKKIKLFVETSIEDLEKMKPMMPIFFDFWSLSVRNQKIKKAIKRYYQNFLDLLKPIIEEGIENGEFCPMDPAEAAIALGSLYEGTILFYIYFPEIIDLKTQFRANFKLTLEGLMSKP
jgi:hypothetical protein